MLADITFEERYNEMVEDYIYYPVFGAYPLSLKDQRIEIEGYIIPIEETQNDEVLILSAFPYSVCFFCGMAGPESVIDIKVKAGQKKDFTLDERVKFVGTLRLNDSDIDYLNYILEEAEFVR